jgi:hypothetical protein
LAATVRLKIDDPDGHSFGSGTIIDVRNGEALILTCAHVFRDSKGKGRVSVDLFGPGAPRGLEGKVVGYDLDRDTGLVSIRTSAAIEPIRVAGAERMIRAGDPVVTVGCSNGNDPTVIHSRIAGLNKFSGPANLQVQGQPVTGRSGGGLFTADGWLIGVCNAADPTDNEGLYAAVASIHAQLDRFELAWVYNPNEEAPMESISPTEDTVPLLASTMPGVGASDLSAVETSAPAARSDSGPAALSGAEQAALLEIQRNDLSSEVICIVRAKDPSSKSEIFVLDKPSTGFLNQLAIEGRTQDQRMLTSHQVPKPEQERPAATATRPVRRQPARSSNWKPNWKQSKQTQGRLTAVR